MDLSLPLDWTYFAVRFVFIALLYLFLWRVMRLLMRELQVFAVQPQGKRTAKAKLIVIDPAESILETGTTFSISTKATVGRHPDCTIAVEEPFLSGIHARFEWKNQAWYLIDQDSTNGTFVNGKSVNGSIYIENDDIVQLGRLKLQFVA